MIFISGTFQALLLKFRKRIISEKKVLKKAERKKCWDSKDRFQECFHKNNEQLEPCMELRKLYESDCPESWVKHFDRKFEYEKFKTSLYKDGISKADEKYANKE